MNKEKIAICNYQGPNTCVGICWLLAFLENLHSGTVSSTTPGERRDACLRAETEAMVAKRLGCTADVDEINQRLATFVPPDCLTPSR